PGQGQPLPGAEGLQPGRRVLLRGRPDRGDPAQGEVHGGGPLRGGPEDLAALLVLRADGSPPAQLPGRHLAPEGSRDARPAQIGPPMQSFDAVRVRAVFFSLAVVGACLAVGTRPADAQFIPYFGKNKVTYDTFNWRVYKSPHF